jgi:hypothetical protein
MASRYDQFRILNNDSAYYAPLRKSRGLKNIQHYETPVLRHPGALERAILKSETHIWKYGNRFYNLADKYYGNVNYWWIIAWYNGYPTEADISNGDVIEIPLSLEEVSVALGL